MRLAVPISYNFLLLTKSEDAAVYRVMGPVRYVKFLGEHFNRWVFPLCLAIMALLTAFNFYGRLLNCIGLKQYAFDNEYTDEKVDEGKYLIEKYRTEKLLHVGLNFYKTGKTTSASTFEK